VAYVSGNGKARTRKPSSCQPLWSAISAHLSLESIMTEKNSVALVPLTFSEIRTLRRLLLTKPSGIGDITQEEKERIVLKLHAALEGVTPLMIDTNRVQ